MVVGLLYGVGTLLLAPAPRVRGQPPTSPPLIAVAFPSQSGTILYGWLARQVGGHGGIVLLHGLRSDRTSMVERARFLYAAGYTVLLLDLQGHGESPGTRLTFGYREALDARAAVAFSRQQLHAQPIAALGVSLGGAACVLGASPLAVDALVLEAVYTDVRKAIANRLRLRLGAVGAWLTPVFTLQLALRTGMTPALLRPVEHIAFVHAPVLIIAGTHDQHTTLDDSQRLFAAAPEPKKFWVIPGASHVDFHRYAGLEYQTRVLQFLQQHMQTREP